MLKRYATFAFLLNVSTMGPKTRLHKHLDPVWMVLSVIQQYQAERIFIFKWLFGAMNTSDEP